MVISWPAMALVATSTGRGKYARTTSDRYGFPRAYLTRTKRHYGYATGDLVRAVVPTGKGAGTHVGRVVVRSVGKFDIRTVGGLAKSIHHRHVRLLQRADGWAYSMQREGTPMQINGIQTSPGSTSGPVKAGWATAPCGTVTP